jgi:D-alanine-D-alanine ligase
VTEIVPSVKFDDCAANYSQGVTKRIQPAPDLPFVYQEARRSRLAAHVALGCRGVSRADFRFDDRIEGTGASSVLRSTPNPA